MGQKTHPKGFRLVTTQKHASEWYSNKLNYPELIEEDFFIRQKVDTNVHHNLQSMIFTVPHGASRDALIDHLGRHNIESTLGTYCLSATTYYLEKYNNVQENSLWLESHTITLPCYEGVDVFRVLGAINEFFD